MYGIKCTALRFFNVFGVGQNMDNLKQGMASIYLAMAVRDHHIVVKGAADRFRDFVYIDDIVESVRLSMNRANGGMFEVYNVSNCRPVYVHQIVETIEQSLPYNVTHEYVAGTPGDQKGIYGDYSKIEKDLGWKGKISFEDGMKLMIDWATASAR
jgi:UDP-glucose 4-epimerase